MHRLGPCRTGNDEASQEKDKGARRLCQRAVATSVREARWPWPEDWPKDWPEDWPEDWPGVFTVSWLNSHGAPIGRTERCFRTEWPPSHVNIGSERHFLINPGPRHGIAAFQPLLRSRALEPRIVGSEGREAD